MNYGRWVTVLLLALSMGIAVSILLIPGERYQTLTTSDSGWNYDVAAIIDNTNALADNIPISHAPYGMKVEPQQLQPLTTVMLYRAVNAINPSVTLADVVKYWGPIMFAIAIIPIFLVGRELGGNVAGCTAAFLAATMINSIYWNKVGAFDREAMETLFGALTMFFVIKLFKAQRQDIPSKQGKKYTLLKIGNHALVFEPWRIRAWLAPYQDILKFSLLAGLSGGLFSLAWSGWLYVMATVVFGIMLVLILGFLGGLLKKFDVAGAFSSAIKSHMHVIIGVLGMVVVASVVLWALASVEPVSMWVGFGQTLLGYVGISVGGGGVSLPGYASEAQPAGSFGDTFGGFYGADILTFFVIALLALGIMKLLWSRRKWELLTIAWFVILLAMVWPGKGVARFDRLWWPLLPVLAGVGIATLTSLARKFTTESSAEWAKWIYHPLLPILTVALVCSAFVANAGAAAAATTPPTEWRGGLDSAFLESFDWIRTNATSENITSIQWSFGHLFTGVTQRPAVTDGSEAPAWQGQWEQSGSIRPPDYILYSDGNTGYIYGVNAARVPGAINGRRIDVQWFPRMGLDELKWYLKTYRDDYGCKIDYLIFSADEYSTAYYLDQNFQEFGYYYLYEESRRLVTPSQESPTVQDNELVFNFGGGWSAVALGSNGAHIGADNLDGYAFFTVDANGKLASIFTPSSSLQINAVLVMILDDRDGVVTDSIYNGTLSLNTIINRLIASWVSKGTYGEVARLPERIGVQAFYTDVGGMVGDNSLEVVFTSSNGYVKIIQVNHQFIT